MRKVIGIGETILDIIFKNDQPTAAKPGGSTFNSMITLGRLGVDTEFISEVGRDRLGKQIKDFLAENNVKADNVYDYDGGKTALSLAFLDENMNADYLFYKNDSAQKLDYVMPKIEENDIIVTSARHYEALMNAKNAIQRVISGMNMGIPTDLLSEDLRLCLGHLADITGGQISTDEVLGNIFSHFCVGKKHSTLGNS